MCFTDIYREQLFKESLQTCNSSGQKPAKSGHVSGKWHETRSGRTCPGRNTATVFRCGTTHLRRNTVASNQFQKIGSEPEAVIGMKSIKRQPSKSSVLQQIKDWHIPVESIIDVGIHHATSDLMQAFPNLKHHLFEPVDDHFEQIEANYRAAGIDYELNKVAVSNEDGFANLKVSSIHDDDVVTHSGLTTDADDTGVLRRVPTVKLDSFVAQNRIETPYLIKLDVDGAEELILEGATHALKECSILIVESTRTQMFKRMEIALNAGFELLDIVDLCYHRGFLWQVDLVFVNPNYVSAEFRDATTRIDSLDDWSSLKLKRPPLIERKLKKIFKTN